MFSIRQDDVLRALKKSRRLAKQDLLIGPQTSDPDYWTRQAQARRSVYDMLMQEVEQYGVESAYQRAVRAYAALPLFHVQRSKATLGATPSKADPDAAGKEQAYEFFFSVLGITDMKLTHLRNARRGLKGRQTATPVST